MINDYLVRWSMANHHNVATQLTHYKTHSFAIQNQARHGNVTNYGGTVSPGDPLGVPGVLTVSSNYTQTPSATLEVQIGGGDPGQVSVLNVLGSANLNGSLDPELVNGFVPSVGQSFTILGYASVTGSFSHIQNQVFDSGRKRWVLVYQPTGAALVVVNNGRNDSH